MSIAAEAIALGRVALLKRCSRGLSNAYRDYPTDQTYKDLQEIEAWITELGGDVRKSAHTAIIEGKERSD